MEGELDQLIDSVNTFFQAKELEATQGNGASPAEPS
jgi:hypothetical protein